MPEWISDEQAADIHAKAEQIRETLVPLASVTAAAARLTTRRDGNLTTRRTQRPAAESWQDEAWDMVRLVGELHFLINRLANQIGQGALYVGEIEPGKPTSEPVESTNPTVQAVLAAFGFNHAGRSQIMRRMAANLIVSGEVWLLGLDEDNLNTATEPIPEQPYGITPAPVTLPPTENNTPLTELVWRALSVSECGSPRNDGTVEVTLEDSTKIHARMDDVQLSRCWRSDDRRAWQADSAVAAALPVLREIVGIGMHTAATIDSRLAGVGILAVKESVIKAARVGAKLPPESEGNPILDSLIEAMMVPIQDRDTPAAVVPLILPFPDDVENPLQYLSFATPLDAASGPKMESAIRRLALSMDCPPELLLGTASMNHWGAWLVNEDTVAVHIEPPLALICDALTTQYLWPALIQTGMAERDAQRYVVWYSVDHMVVRPNQFEEATALWEAGLVDDDTYRRAGGFDLSDDPEEDGREGKLSEQEAIRVAVEMTLTMLRRDPGLASAPGPTKLAADLVKLLTGDLEQPAPPPMIPGQSPADPSGGNGKVPADLPSGPTTDGAPEAEAAPA